MGLHMVVVWSRPSEVMCRASKRLQGQLPVICFISQVL